ncbi:MAG: ATP-binding protein [Nitriliruptor sp.]
MLTDPCGPLAELEGPGSDYQMVADLDQCLTELRSGDRRVSLVVLGPGLSRPLSAARRIRDLDAEVGLVFAVAAGEVATMRSRLALVPRAAGTASVVAFDDGIEALRRELADSATSSRRRQRLRRALDTINLDLAGSRVDTDPGRPSGVSERYLAALVRHAADTILAIDPEGRVVTINDAGQRTFGLDPEGVEGKFVGDLLADHDAGGLLELLTAAEDGQARIDEELPLLLRDGRELLVSATAAPIRDDLGTPVGTVLIARDVTVERRAEERLRALQKAESLATLASGVAHDFNNLLVQVQGWAELARDDPHDTELVSEALDRISAAAGGAAELARAMLAYGGRGNFTLERLELAHLIAELRSLLTSSVPAKIQFETDLTAVPAIRADPTQIRQVILNLVSNASEAIGDRTGTIFLRTGTEEIGGGDGDQQRRHRLSPGPYAIIEVEDTGPGIGADIQDRLFDPFFTTKFAGRGLGLAASQGIARAHGGVITVDGRPGEGARFRVHLPVAGGPA